MTLCQFHDDSGVRMDAQFEVRKGKLILYSRSGTKGTPEARNTEYGLALRILLQRIGQSDLTLVGVWVDSSRAQKLLPRKKDRQIFSPQDSNLLPDELFTLLSNKMAKIGRDSNNRGSRGNSTKRLLFAFADDPPRERIVQIAGWGRNNAAQNRHGRLPAAELKKVSIDHIFHAVQQLSFPSVKHPFGESHNYDVVTDDGQHLPPKAVFGLAASEALGFEVLPRHFASTDAIREKISEAGFRVVPKDEPSPHEEVPLNPEDRVWIEGHPRLSWHLKRERASGLAQAKKAAFRREHGELFCEKCGLYPVEEYGPDAGDACIEVHHKLPIADMPPAKSTQLKDLMCVCANCHRIIHHELRNSHR